MAGFIKIHRQITEWEWYTDIPVRILFEHCLFKANFEDKKWRGIVIKRGSFITSYENLSFETGLTVRQIRTALDKLKTTGELTHETTSQYSMITVKNWEKYQANDKQNDKQMTSERQTNDKQATTTINKDSYRKNIKNIRIKEIENNKVKKLDPYINPIKTFFLDEYQKEMGTMPRLSSFECQRLVELAADNSDIRELIPEAIKRLKRINFGDIPFNPTANWLLKDNNFERVINGEFEPKKSQAELYRERMRQCESN